MITIQMNGKKTAVKEGHVSDLLSHHGYDDRRVVVELNGDILRRESWGEAPLRDGDRVEIIGFMGGG